MNFVILGLKKNGTYTYKEASSVEMNILGSFFSDIGHRNDSFLFFKKWVLDDSLGTAFGTNTTFLEKDGDYIILTDSIPGDPDEEEDLTELKMSHKQFAQLAQDWEKKVYKKKPMEVIIKYENDTFVIETKGDTVEEKKHEVDVSQEELKIDFVKLNLINNEIYSCKESSNLEMNVIGKFFADIGLCREKLFYYQDWPFADSFNVFAETKNIALRKERDYIFLVDKNDQTIVKMPRHYLAQLVSDWEEKVYRTKAKEVIINRKNGEFSIEIKK